MHAALGRLRLSITQHSEVTKIKVNFSTLLEAQNAVQICTFSCAPGPTRVRDNGPDNAMVAQQYNWRYRTSKQISSPLPPPNNVLAQHGSYADCRLYFAQRLFAKSEGGTQIKEKIKKHSSSVYTDAQGWNQTTSP